MKILLEDMFKENEFRKQIIDIKEYGQKTLGRSSEQSEVLLPVKGMADLGKEQQIIIGNRRNTISRKHAILGNDKNGWYIEDCSSYGRTAIDDKELSRQKKYLSLDKQHKIKFGDYEFRLSFLDSAETARQ